MRSGASQNVQPEHMPMFFQRGIDRHSQIISPHPHTKRCANCSDHDLCTKPLPSLLCVAITSYFPALLTHRMPVYPAQTSSAQQNSPNFMLNGINAHSSPFSSAPGYPPLPAPLATASLPAPLENALNPEYAGNGHTLHTFPVADAPSAGAVAYNELASVVTPGSGIKGEPTRVVGIMTIQFITLRSTRYHFFQ